MLQGQVSEFVNRPRYHSSGQLESKRACAVRRKLAALFEQHFPLVHVGCTSSMRRFGAMKPTTGTRHFLDMRPCLRCDINTVGGPNPAPNTNKQWPQPWFPSGAKWIWQPPTVWVRLLGDVVLVVFLYYPNPKALSSFEPVPMSARARRVERTQVAVSCGRLAQIL